jgi:hypothetical protein
MRLAAHKLPMRTKFVAASSGVRTMKAQQVRDLDEQELKAKIRRSRRQVFRLRFQMRWVRPTA